jgi:ketosteroid isomerase-like protein
MRALNALLVLIATIVVILLVARLPPPSAEMSEAEIAQSEGEVAQAIAEQWVGVKSALEDEDYEAWASYWTEDVWILEPGMNLRGNDLRDTVREIFDSGTEILEWNVRPAETFVHGRVAYQMGEMDEALQPPGAGPTEREGYSFVRWENEGAVWRIDRLVVGPRDAPAEG